MTPRPLRVLFQGDLPKGINPMVGVIVVDGQARSLPLLRERGRGPQGVLVSTWRAGQNSALDTRATAQGRDVGNVVIRRTQGGQGDGKARDVVYDDLRLCLKRLFPGPQNPRQLNAGRRHGRRPAVAGPLPRGYT